MAMDELPSVRLAAVQAAPVLLDRDRTVARACELIVEAGSHGARVVGFPENFIPGHPYWYQFYNGYDARCKSFNIRYFQNAVAIPSDAVTALGEAARQAEAWVVIGVAEKEPDSYGTIYNTQLCFSPDGTLVGKHRKLALTNSERLVQHYGDASTLGTYQTPFGRLGGLICGEHFNSLARTALLLEGEVLHVASWPALAARNGVKGYHSMDVRVQFTAMEGRIFVISAASIWTDEMFDVLELDDEARSLFKTRGGHSGIVVPSGEYIAGPIDGEPTILYADANIAETVALKISQDVTGHYQRFDLFDLRVNRDIRSSRLPS
jgi:aliphatic nitrilase